MKAPCDHVGRALDVVAPDRGGAHSPIVLSSLRNERLPSMRHAALFAGATALTLVTAAAGGG